MRLPRFLLLLTLAMPSFAAEPDSRLPTRHPFRQDITCNYNRVLAGPSGAVAVYLSDAPDLMHAGTLFPPTVIATGRIDDGEASDRIRFFSYYGQGLRLFPIRWTSRGDRLFVRVRESRERMIAIDANGGRVMRVGPIDPSWRSIPINVTSHGDIAALDDPTALALARRIDGHALLRGQVTLGHGVQMIAARAADVRIVRVGADLLTPSDLNIQAVERLTAFPDDRDYANGIAYLGAPMKKEAAALPYQLPIVDLETGRIAGRFGPTRIELRRPGPLASTVDQFNREQLASAVVLDASLSGNALFVLTLSEGTHRRLYRLGQHGLSTLSLCNRTPLGPRLTSPATSQQWPIEPATIRIFRVSEDGQETNAPGRPILVVHHMGAAPSDQAILYFHGGPAATLADRNYSSDAADHLLRPGIDVIEAEYAGSQGGGPALQRRLADDGMGQLAVDVDAITRWLDRANYGQVSVMGASFGAVPALLAISRHRDRYPRSFFLVPMLRLLDPRALAERAHHLVNVPAPQLTWEQDIYGGVGGRQRFAAALDRLVAQAPLGPNDHFYFAQFDPLSQPEDLPGDNHSPVMTAPGQHHQMIGLASMVWADIEAQLP